MSENDGDIIRAVGYVTIYAAYLEEVIDEILVKTGSIARYDKKKKHWPISSKIKHVKDMVAKIKNSEIEGLYQILSGCSNLFERRNEVLHGRIYANFGRPDILISGRSAPDREVTAEELYSLANDLYSAVRGIGCFRFGLPRAVDSYLKNTKKGA